MNYIDNNITVCVESTNNERCVKFVLNFLPIKEEFKVYCKNSFNKEENNLALKLFEVFPEIEEVFFSANYLAVSFAHSHTNSANYLELVKGVVESFYCDSNVELLNKQLILEIQKNTKLFGRLYQSCC